MKISEVKIRKIFDENVLKAVVSVTFDNCFTVHDIKVINANAKHFIVMPNKKTADGRIADIAHPINREFRDEIENVILETYFKAEGKRSRPEL